MGSRVTLTGGRPRAPEVPSDARPTPPPLGAARRLCPRPRRRRHVRECPRRPGARTRADGIRVSGDRHRRPPLRRLPLPPRAARRGTDRPGRGVVEWRHYRNPHSPVRGGPMRCRRCGYPLSKGQAACPDCGATEAARWWRRALVLALAGAALAAAFAALLLRG